MELILKKIMFTKNNHLYKTQVFVVCEMVSFTSFILITVVQYSGSKKNYDLKVSRFKVKIFNIANIVLLYENCNIKSISQLL